MACNTYNDIIDCSMSVGGIQKVFIFPFGSLYDYVYSDDNLSYISDYKIDNLAAEILCQKNTVLSETIDRQATDTYSYNLSLSISKMEWEKRSEIFKLIRGKLTIIVKDENGKCWIMGKNTPVRLSSYDASTGEINGESVYQISFSNVDKKPIKQIKCYDTNCAISVIGTEVRQSLFTIDDASTFNFSGFYELLGDTITRDITPLSPLDPTNWTNPSILAGDTATIQSIANPNGNTVVNLYYDSGSDTALIVLLSTDTSYPFMTIGGQALSGIVSIDINLVTTLSTSLSGVVITVTDESSTIIYSEPLGDTVTGFGLSGIAENSYINVSTLYPLGQRFTVSVSFLGEACTFGGYEYTYEPSNECQLLNQYSLHNGKRYSVIVDKLTSVPAYRDITIVIGEYQFNLYNNYNDYHNVFSQLESHVINSLANYPDLNITNVTVTEQTKTWTLTFDSLDDDNLDFYVITRGNDSTLIDELDLVDVRKYLSTRSTVLAMQTTGPSDSELSIVNSTNGAGVYGEVSQYPHTVIDARLEEVFPFTNAVTNSIGIDINDWIEDDSISVSNVSVSCPDVTNNFTIDTCYDRTEITNLNQYYLFSLQTLNLGDSISFDTSVSGIITVVLPSDITPANYPDFGDFMKNSVPEIYNANLQFDAISETFYLEVMIAKTNNIISVTSDNTSTPFVLEQNLDEWRYNIQTKQHPDINISWTVDSFYNPSVINTGVIKDYINKDNKVEYKHSDFIYNSTTDELEINLLFNSTTQGYTFEFFYVFPFTPAVAPYTVIVSPTTFNTSVVAFSTFLTITSVRYVRIRNGQGYEQIIRWNGSTEQDT